jgi:RNase H-fold protein (predicted Holliday junction resolvase)
MVIFAHGSGSSRFSPRNQMVANYLHEYNLGTFLFDLLRKQNPQKIIVAAPVAPQSTISKLMTEADEEVIYDLQKMERNT